MLKLNIAVIIAVLFSAIALSTSSLYCQNDNPPIWDQYGNAPIVKTIDGIVTSVDPQNFTISVKTVENLTFSARPGTTKITNSDGFSIELSSINAGNYVMVEYYDDKSGAHIARGINVEYTR